MVTYTYDITSAIPGGEIDLNGATGLILKILNTIATQFITINQTRDNKLNIVFINTLTPAEKTLLDSYVNLAADYVDVLVNNVSIPFFQPITIPSDGQIHLEITLQRRKGDGTIRLGTNEPVKIKTQSIMTLTPRIGNIDPGNGQFKFIVGPDHHRGTTICIIYVDSLPTQRIAVEFT